MQRIQRIDRGKVANKIAASVLCFDQAEDFQLLDGGAHGNPADAEGVAQLAFRRQFLTGLPYPGHQLRLQLHIHLGTQGFGFDLFQLCHDWSPSCSSARMRFIGMKHGEFVHFIRSSPVPWLVPAPRACGVRRKDAGGETAHRRRSPSGVPSDNPACAETVAYFASRIASTALM